MDKNCKFLDDYRDMERSDFMHFLSENTRWGDSDAMGHINNVQYARYYECSRSSYFNEVAGINFIGNMAAGVILADMKIAYLQQLHHPASMIIGARVSRLGNSSLHYDSAVFIEGNEIPISTSRATLVWFDYTQNKALRIPSEIRDMINNFESLPPLQS